MYWISVSKNSENMWYLSHDFFPLYPIWVWQKPTLASGGREDETFSHL